MSDFKCSKSSARDLGSVHIEQLSCKEVVSKSSGVTPRTVEVVRTIFPPEKLNVIDINAKRRFLIAKHHGAKAAVLAELKGIFANTKDGVAIGGTASQALAMPDFSDVAVVTGGIYYALPNSDKHWPEIGQEARQGDGFVWYKPDPNNQGAVLSENQLAVRGDRVKHPEPRLFYSGGYLQFPFTGSASLVALVDGGVFQNRSEDSFKNYRLIVQSNIVLVANGQEDKNSDVGETALAALSTQKDGKASLVVAANPGFTPQEFGNLLVRWGSQNAINLDGGPSPQIAVRKEGSTNTQKPAACVERLIDGDPMPLLFSVSK